MRMRMLAIGALCVALTGCAAPVAIAVAGAVGAIGGPVIGLDEDLLQMWAKSKGYQLSPAQPQAAAATK